jgi:hypothetical protein
MDTAESPDPYQQPGAHALCGVGDTTPQRQRARSAKAWLIQLRGHSRVRTAPSIPAIDAGRSRTFALATAGVSHDLAHRGVEDVSCQLGTQATARSRSPVRSGP